MLTSELYKKVYHYTTLQGLLGILESKCLWATHYRFLNDSSERVLIKNRLIEILYPFVLERCKDLIKKYPHIEKDVESWGGVAIAAKQETTTLIDVLYRTTGEEIYISSFCGETGDSYVDSNGLLSQWRGYGRDGGIAVVFDTKKLEEALNAEVQHFDYSYISVSDLIYSNDEEKFKSELSAPLSDLTDFAGQMFWNATTKEGEIPDAKKAYPAFVQCTSRYKHCGFREENEVRIIVAPIAHTQSYKGLAKDAGEELKLEKPRIFREKNGERIPYIELYKFKDIALPIEKIIVGPHKEKEARSSMLKAMLRNTDIKVAVSEIPYIG